MRNVKHFLVPNTARRICLLFIYFRIICHSIKTFTYFFRFLLYQHQFCDGNYVYLQLDGLPAKFSSEHKPANKPVFRNILLALYIQLGQDIQYISKLSVLDPRERYVHCLFCNSMATLKPTKTGRIMLRCNTCSVLVFANGLLSQQRIKTLKDYRFTSVC